MSDRTPLFQADRAAGVLMVLALHGAALWGLWQHRLIPTPDEAVTLFVNFVAPPPPEKKAEPRQIVPSKIKPVEPARSRQIVAETHAVAPTDPVAAPPSARPDPVPEPVIQAPPPALPVPSGPVPLSSELSVACPERSAPVYPAPSRRLGETGAVVLRVELSETGHVAQARVERSSGHPRLDEAALAAVRTWRCTPASRNGQAVRAVALQPFNFILSGN